MTDWRIIRPNPDNMDGSRPLSAIRMILVHCTQGDTAEGAAVYWARPHVERGTEGSAHVVFDDDSAIRAVDDDQIAYGAFGFNTVGLHIEMAGHVEWTRDTWLGHDATLRQAAAFQAAAHKAYGVPFAWSLTHGYHSHAGLPGNDHTDPGPNFPWDVYRGYVKDGLIGAIANPPAPLKYGNTLRLQLYEAGHKQPYVDCAGWERCLPPMRSLARMSDKTAARKLCDKEAIFTWRGNAWRLGGKFGGSAVSVIPRVRTVLNNYGPRS